MEEKKASPELLKLAGEETAKLLLDKVEKINKELGDRLAAVAADHMDAVRTAAMAILDSQENKLAENDYDTVMGLLRGDVIDKSACEFMAVAGAVQAQHPLPMSEYAAHALVHYEQGIQESYRNQVSTGLKSLLSAFGSHLREEPEKPAVEPQPEAAPV